MIGKPTQYSAWSHYIDSGPAAANETIACDTSRLLNGIFEEESNGRKNAWTHQSRDYTDTLLPRPTKQRIGVRRSPVKIKVVNLGSLDV